MADEHGPPAPAPGSATSPNVSTPAPAATPAPSTSVPSTPVPSTSVPSTSVPSTDAILGLVDRLEALLRDAGVSELDVEAGGLGITLRKPGAVGPAAAGPGVTAGASAGDSAGGAQPGAPAAPEAGRTSGARLGSEPASEPAPRLHAVLAPLTGTWYLTPSPGAAPYVKPGDDVTSGQIIGLIEAMKLFNEIKSDASGRVARVLVEHGALVKAKQALVEIEPAR